MDNESKYNNRRACPDHPLHIERWANASEAFRASWEGYRSIRYGDDERQRLDYFPATGQGGATPLAVIIHGGYWQALDESYFGFTAAPLVRRGISVMVPTYPLCPGSSFAQVMTAFAQFGTWLAGNTGKLGIDGGRVALAGHSAGGHLAAWLGRDCAGIRFKTVLGISGIYDLEPLIDTSINGKLSLDSATARQFSPMRHPLASTDRFVVIVGGDELAGFHEQATGYAKHLAALDVDHDLVTVPGADHFTVVDSLTDTGSPVFRQLAGSVSG